MRRERLRPGFMSRSVTCSDPDASSRPQCISFLRRQAANLFREPVMPTRSDTQSCRLTCSLIVHVHTSGSPQSTPQCICMERHPRLELNDTRTEATTSAREGTKAHGTELTYSGVLTHKTHFSVHSGNLRHFCAQLACKLARLPQHIGAPTLGFFPRFVSTPGASI